MTALKVVAMPTDQARAFQNGGLDANGQLPEVHTAQGPRNPCRHCLSPIEEGADMLILSYRPFDTPQPYAEQGPIFLHKRQCKQHAPNGGLPEMFQNWDTVIVRGYGRDDRIQYMSAAVVPVDKVEETCHALLAQDGVEYLHIRTSRYNCFQCRVERAS